jgi:predicted dehydrogenase
MPDRRLRLGFIGAGFIGQLAHLQNYLTNPRIELVAVAEARNDLRDKVRHRYRFPAAYRDEQELLADPRVEAVVAITARPQTGPLALKVLKAGKHLLTEKPMCGTLAQAERLTAAAREAGVVYQVGYNRRHDAGTEIALGLFRKAMASGELGQLNYMRARHFSGDPYRKIVGDERSDEKPPELERWPMSPEWLGEPHRPGYEHFVNVSCHAFGLVRHFLPGRYRVEHAAIGNPRGQVVIVSNGSRQATLEFGDFGFNGWDKSLEFYFDRGRLRIDYPTPMTRNVAARVELYKGGEEPTVIRPQTPAKWSFALQAEAFVDAILDGTPNIASGEDALEDIRLIEQTWRKALGLEERAS